MLASREGDASLAAIRSSPPKWLFGLANDIAPGQTDVVQVAFRPLGEFTALALALPPDVERLAELRQKSPAMMICH
jgi:hypothetical protein